MRHNFVLTASIYFIPVKLLTIEVSQMLHNFVPAEIIYRIDFNKNVNVKNNMSAITHV